MIPRRDFLTATTYLVTTSSYFPITPRKIRDVNLFARCFDMDVKIYLIKKTFLSITDFPTKSFYNSQRGELKSKRDKITGKMKI